MKIRDMQTRRRVTMSLRHIIGECHSTATMAPSRQRHGLSSNASDSTIRASTSTPQHPVRQSSVRASTSTPLQHHLRDNSVRGSTFTSQQFPTRDSTARLSRSTLRVGPRLRGQSVDEGTPATSRAASPLRFFQSLTGLHRAQSRSDEPFVPVDPFQLRLSLRIRPLRNPSSVIDVQHPPVADEEGYNFECNDTIVCCLPIPCTSRRASVDVPKSTRTAPLGQVAETILRIVYLHVLLRLPALYFTRVARIFEDAEVSKKEVQGMIDVAGTSRFGTWDRRDAAVVQGALRTNAEREERERLDVERQREGHGPQPPSKGRHGRHARVESVPIATEGSQENTMPVSPTLAKFKHSWETFVDSLQKEWKTLNVVSALLLSAILTMFQIEDAAEDPVTRTAALFSLICAIMSLSFGCIFTLRFGTMRSMYKASRWAEEAQKTKTAIFWNVWVLLGMPAIWLAWSVIAFVTSIMAFLWRTGSTRDPDDRPKLSPQQVLGPRIALTVLFGIGMLYFSLCIITFRSYGSMDDIRTAAANARRDGDDIRRRTEDRRQRQAGQDGRPNAGSRPDAQERLADPEKNRDSRAAMHGSREADELGLASMGAPSPAIPGRVRDEVDLEKGAGRAPLVQTYDMGA
ncbi:hypothetical protein PUNSTDRAFT_146574 [Punctularia strigosozonata HHB-11173 SS5]|uniref:Uncharacterized protein n=1 Tax=Punctularia strigosozonata (strain HHB-11173) TaxID=741275 RepID=R7S501_PUNST|nr:uncharacterized protein PUNSTDRAFT_146574 [Punctularia strigosozonata HHB-11173 SS5]EIN04361.1 hypothetical protein PUNSTDRAFT_146574 [Punctularia strigosozonata HHB-11173 SS5]